MSFQVELKAWPSKLANDAGVVLLGAESSVYIKIGPYGHLQRGLVSR